MWKYVWVCPDQHHEMPLYQAVGGGIVLHPPHHQTYICGLVVDLVTAAITVISPDSEGIYGPFLSINNSLWKGRR